ncbi:hypothetical protein BASA60_004339 [Batrachochytrium salamandrivorans]|nr:hypothetical protein BASA60_004339 [Batrachochytrium salamandrivorans]
MSTLAESAAPGAPDHHDNNATEATTSTSTLATIYSWCTKVFTGRNPSIPNTPPEKNAFMTFMTLMLVSRGKTTISLLLVLLVLLYFVVFMYSSDSINPLLSTDHKLSTASTSALGSCSWQPKSIAKLVDTPYVRIPHIIHQSWKTNVLPLKFKKWQTFPWMLERFNSFSKNINRADTARYMYMYMIGGFYADLDVDCLKPHTPIANKGGIVLPLMSRDYTFEHNIPNSWLGSVPGHPFWIFLLNKIKDRPLDQNIEASTGPIVLYHALREFELNHMDESMPTITYMPKELVIPYDWHNTEGLLDICSATKSTINTTRCRELVDPFNKAFTITYWSHSWGDGDGQISKPFSSP